MATAKKFDVACDTCCYPVRQNVGTKEANLYACSHMKQYHHNTFIIPTLTTKKP
jgi:hypothetical protein